MKIKLPITPSLPPPLSLSSNAIDWFVSYSPLKCKKILIDCRLPAIYIRARAQNRILYSELRKQIQNSLSQPSPSSKAIPKFHLLRLFNIEKRNISPSTPNYLYPSWIFGKHENKPYFVTPTPHPTADQIIFLLSIPYKEWGNYLNFDMCWRYHPDILYGRNKS